MIKLQPPGFVLVLGVFLFSAFLIPAHGKRQLPAFITAKREADWLHNTERPAGHNSYCSLAGWDVS